MAIKCRSRSKLGGDNVMNYECFNYASELYHHGILGQKWGVRRFQNSDGSLTPDGIKRYRTDLDNMSSRISSINSNLNDLTSSFINSSGTSKASRSDSINDLLDSFKSKKISDVKTDMLDYANRKGLLDFLDSKADAPFKSIRSTYEKQTHQSSSEKEQYQPAAKDPLRALENARRYADMVSSMQYWKPETIRYGSEKEILGVHGVHANENLRFRNADKINTVAKYIDANTSKFSKSLGESFVDRIVNEDMTTRNQLTASADRARKFLNDLSSDPVTTKSKADRIARDWVKDMSSFGESYEDVKDSIYGSIHPYKTNWGTLKYPQRSEISSVVRYDSRDNGGGLGGAAKPSTVLKRWDDTGQVKTVLRDTGTDYMMFNNEAVEDFLRKYAP